MIGDIPGGTTLVLRQEDERVPHTEMQALQEGQEIVVDGEKSKRGVSCLPVTLVFLGIIGRPSVPVDSAIIPKTR